jgi:hypothetical protein
MTYQCGTMLIINRKIRGVQKIRENRDEFNMSYLNGTMLGLNPNNEINIIELMKYTI